MKPTTNKDYNTHFKVRWTENGVERTGTTVIINGDNLIILPPDGSYVIKSKNDIELVQ